MIMDAHGRPWTRRPICQGRADGPRTDSSQHLGAEDVLHDLGIIPITSSDAQGMGRAGETIRRTFALAAKMKNERGSADLRHDNDRARRYIARLTINPAIAHGMAHEIGSLKAGKLVDIVLWRPDHFGAKPELVLKAGFPTYGVTGDPNASIDSSRPLVIGLQLGGYGPTPADLSVAFVSQAAAESREDRLPTRRRRVGVRGTRGIGPADMVHNDRSAEVRVDGRTGRVTVDGDPVSSAPTDSLALSRLYFL